MRNQDNKVAFVLVDEDGELVRSSGFIRTCHNMNIIVQTKDGYAYSLNGKSEIPNNTLANITIDLILNSNHNKELLYFAYKYAICLSCLTYNRLCGDVPYSLCHGSRPSYRNIKKRGVRVYIINGNIKRKDVDYVSHCGYLMGYAATTGVILYWKPYQLFIIHRDHNVWFDEYNYRLFIEDKYTPGYLIIQQDPKTLIHNSYLLNLIPCELDLTYTPSFYTIDLLLEIKLVLIQCMMKIL